ncbi:hypothetical protein PRIPAC_96465 [Pristionchus pacificus]|uniref:Uncharacterized protein n=1 Tax=Pristionchus pacificus TaxID=54126 RepID=A0A2A6B394_PRIPA|nr:hypothetical protein PRIPAC_96465 [Pristionchus pacificus]|eukprot:PDM60340.1 hypothetical protein PRIPAC_54165 [Pristionchus pacificus]
MSDAKLTPEMIEKFKAGRVTLKANPTILDASIGKLSAAAQVPAKKMRDLMLSAEEDPAKMQALVAAIKESVSEDLKKELEAHKAEVHKILGIPV